MVAPSAANNHYSTNDIAAIAHIQHGAFAPLSPAITAFSHQGERYLPLVRNYSAAMHLGHMASYREALRYAYGRRMLDIGCGVGYGSFLCASQGATKVVAVDLSHDALDYADYVYQHPNLTYLQADGMALPFADGSFDFIFSSQVIEHVPSTETFMREIKRLLAPDGFCLITAPNLDLFSPSGVSDNEFHLSEMDWNTYQTIARNVFSATQFRGIPQHCLIFDPELQTVIVKPNAQIHKTNYVLQDQHLEICENMLCFGFNAANGRPSSLLDETDHQIVNQLDPFFWDPTIQQWVVMTRYPADLRSTLTLQPAQVLEETLVVRHPAFYRLECDVVAAQQTQIEAALYAADTDTMLAAHRQILSSGDTLEFVFAPLPSGTYRLRVHGVTGDQPVILQSQPLATEPAPEAVIDGGATSQQLAMRIFSVITG